MLLYFIKEANTLRQTNDIDQASWINLYPPFDHGDIDELALHFDIPVDFFTDSLDIDERSRFEREDEFTYILINTPILNDDNRDNEAIYITVPIGIILVGDKIITITPKENPIIEKFMDDKVRNFTPSDGKLFVLQIFEQNVYRFLECLKKLNLKRNLIEQELYNSSRTRELQQLLRIEKSLVYFVTSLSTNELLKLKMKRTDLLKLNDDEFYTELFEDILIDNSQALEMSNVYTNILSGTMEAYASIISNNLNLFIQRLTIITIILMVPTLVASFYGMNLTHLPFQDSRFAFPIIIIFSFIFGGGLIWYFSKNKFNN
jgi:magnesium transporter